MWGHGCVAHVGRCVMSDPILCVAWAVVTASMPRDSECSVLNCAPSKYCAEVLSPGTPECHCLEVIKVKRGHGEGALIQDDCVLRRRGDTETHRGNTRRRRPRTS